MIEKFDTDLLTESIPGSSWALEPGSLPMDKPPATVDLKEAFNTIAEGLNKKRVKRNLVKAVSSGVSIQSIAQILTKQGVNEGAFNPDLAMLLDVPIVLKIFEIVSPKVSNIKIFNEMLELEEPDDEEMLAIQEKLAPKNMYTDPETDAIDRKIQDSLKNIKEEDAVEGFMPLPEKGVI